MIKRIWNEWEVTEKISEGSFGEVYKATNKEGTLCAVKYISLPKSDEEIETLLKNKIIDNISEVNDYYLNIANKIEKEIEIMQRFNGNPYIIDCYEFLKAIKPTGIGIDFYIRMEYAQDIEKYFHDKKIDVNDVIKLGIDICTSLELCASLNVTHNDIKPSNIFIGSDNKYKLGDFGIASTIGDVNTNTFGTFNYMAPEIYNKDNLDSSTDLYSLGLVLYKLIDGNVPFVSKNVDEDEAFKIRMSGKKIPVIKGLSSDVMDILYKACSFNNINRYQSPIEMKEALEKLSNISNSKKKVNFTSKNNNNNNTVSIYDKDIVINKKIKKINNFYNNIKDSFLAVKIKDFFKEKTVLKLSLISLVLVVIIILLIRGCALNRKCGIGYVNKNGMCVKGYYYCEQGYSLNSDNKCQKTLESEDAKVTYTCPKNYTLADEICVNNDIRDPEFVYVCADGFTLKDKKCEREESADAGVTYTCPSKYVLAGDQCVTITNINATSTYTCPDSSYKLSGNTCTKTTTSTVKATVKYTCPNGGTLSGTTCNSTSAPSYSGWYVPTCSKGSYSYTDRMCHYSYSATATYSCSKGTSDGKGNCNYTSTSTENATIKYTCPSGYTVAGSQCAKASGVKATPKYICTDDTELRGTKCYATITTDAVGMYACDEGFVISGTKCYKNDFPEATKKYTCSKVYTLNGDKCEKYEIVSAKAHYDDE